MRIWFAALLPAVLTTACALQPGDHASLTAKTFQTSQSNAWKAAVASLGPGYVIQSADEKDGVLVAEQDRSSESTDTAALYDGLVSPAVANARWSDQHTVVKITVASEGPQRSLVNVKAAYEVLETNVMHSWVAADSNGRLESQIYSKIATQLNSSRT